MSCADARFDLCTTDVETEHGLLHTGAWVLWGGGATAWVPRDLRWLWVQENLL